MSREQSHLTTRQNYDLLSHWYDFFSASERGFSKTGLSLLNVQPGENILEIGFGTGHTLIELAQEVTDSGHIFGIDLSPGMLEMAEKKIRHAGIIGNITLQLGDATCLPFSEGLFEAAFMSFTLELFSIQEIHIVLQECRRVLKPDGRLGVVSLLKRDTVAVRVYEWFHTVLPTLVDCRPILPRMVLSAAGFQVENALVQSMWGLPVEILIARRG